MKTYRNDRDYRRRREALRVRTFRDGLPCAICGYAIDVALPSRHRWSFTADHVEPIAAGGRMDGELVPAHHRCNSARGDREISDVLRLQCAAVFRQEHWGVKVEQFMQVTAPQQW